MNQNEQITVLGATGFVGNALVNFLTEKKKLRKVKILSRNTEKAKKLFGEKVEIVEGDHLDSRNVKDVIKGSATIFSTAGLAWQHPGGKKLSQEELLMEEILQNAMSAYVLGSSLGHSQILIWTSTSATDTMLSTLDEFKRSEVIGSIRMLSNRIIEEFKDNPPSREELQEFSKKIVDREMYGFKKLALQFSYAYSKFLGQMILEKLSRRNIVVLKISDVYGEDQDTSEEVVKQTSAARRLQRLIACYKMIKRGETDWIPAHGFSFQGDKIIHEVWNDVVFPTHVDDICKLMWNAVNLPPNNRVVFEVNGKKVTNLEMTKIVRDAFEVDVEVHVQQGELKDIQERSEDLELLGMRREKLIPLKQGVIDWVA